MMGFSCEVSQEQLLPLIKLRILFKQCFLQLTLPLLEFLVEFHMLVITYSLDV